jgi:hypothetical protein
MNCGLTQEKLLELHKMEIVKLLKGGICQNKRPSDGHICGKNFTEHSVEGFIVSFHHLIL